MVIANSRVHWNVASNYGGGLVGQDDAHVTFSGGTLDGNVAHKFGGGLVAIRQVMLMLDNNTRVHNNRALGGSSGGLCMRFVYEAVVLTINGCIIVNNICMGGVGGGLSIGADVEAIKFGGMGRLEDEAASGGRANYGTRVTISHNTIANNTSHRGAGGGLAAVSEYVVKLSDGTTVVGNRAINSSGGAVMLMGNASFQADNTVVFNNNSAPEAASWLCGEHYCCI
jgi:hypothetical protein